MIFNAQRCNTGRSRTRLDDQSAIEAVWGVRNPVNLAAFDFRKGLQKTGASEESSDKTHKQRAKSEKSFDHKGFLRGLVDGRDGDHSAIFSRGTEKGKRMSKDRIECRVEVWAEAVASRDEFEVVMSATADACERKLVFTPNGALEVAEKLIEAAFEAKKRNWKAQSNNSIEDD